VFRMLAHASLATQTAFSWLLVCLLEFYYRRVSREAWLRWFACSWLAQSAFVAALWIAFDYPSGNIPERLAISLLGFIVPPTIALTGLALIEGRTPSRNWIAALYLAGLIAALATFVAALPYPIDLPITSRIHSVPRYLCYGLASLVTAAAFARYGRRQRLTGALVTAAAWGAFGVLNLLRSWSWYGSSTWALRGAENNSDLAQFALITFISNSAVWILMSIGVGLLLTESAERSERRARDAFRELQAAQTERSRLAQLVERSRDAILVISSGQLRYLNRAAANLLGYTADEIPALFMQAFDHVCGMPPDDPMRAQMDPAIAAAGAWKGQSEWRNRITGERIPVLVGSFAMEPRDGEPAAIGLIARDLRERLRLEEELRQAQRQEALGRLAGGIAHDFNNLLTVMMGYASLVLDQDLSPGLRQSIREILTAAQRAAAITDRLRAFGRRQALHAATFDVNALIHSMRGALDKLVSGGVDLHYELCPAALPVRADAAQIEQVLMNLVLNARQAIDAAGRVVMRTALAKPAETPDAATGEFVKIEIEDSGSGIDPGVLEHIFDPYFTTRSAGTGLGLSMAYGIIKQSDGQIRVDSRPGQGSVFTVFLPVGEAGERAIAAPAQTTHGSVAGHEAVLVVDDRPEVAEFVAASLAHYGYRITTCTTSEAALSAVGDRAAALQLVIRDVMMPGMPLDEFAARLREMRPGLPVICMSGMPEAALAPQIESAGAYFIAKPFTPEQLARMARRVLDAAAILAAD